MDSEEVMECGLCHDLVELREMETHKLLHEISDLNAILRKWLPEIVGAIRRER